MAQPNEGIEDCEEPRQGQSSPQGQARTTEGEEGMTHDTKAAEPALPPLPPPLLWEMLAEAYTADDMREYGRQCAALSASTQAPAVKWRTSWAVLERLRAAAKHPPGQPPYSVGNHDREPNDPWRTVLLSDLQELLFHAGLADTAHAKAPAMIATEGACRYALLKIIEMNRQHARDQYGDADKAESWSCVRVAREALAAFHNARDDQASAEREAFEDWARREGYSVQKVPNATCINGHEVYADRRTHAAWWAWQARAASPARDVLRYRALRDNPAIAKLVVEAAFGGDTEDTTDWSKSLDEWCDASFKVENISGAIANQAPDADAASPAVERDAPAPFTHAQLERLYLNSPAAQNVIGFTGFARIVRLAESAHRITNQAPGEMTHG
jgi:hypothetical protein